MSTLPQHSNPSDRRAAIAAGFLGWTLDAFDFFLVVLTLTAIGKEFGRPDADIVFSLTLTLAFRPVGAFIFGFLADRYGRRLPLMIDLIFYAVVEVLTGLAPSYGSFLVLRALFGIGMGGEWGVGASLVMEKVEPEKRGAVSGLLQQGYAAGYLLAALVYFTFFPRWGWRPLFFIGGLPALVALFIRVRVQESDAWKRTRHPDWRSLFRGAMQHWRTLVVIAILMAMMNMTSHGTQDLYPTFLERYRGLDAHARALVTAISMVGALIGGVVIGRWSDRVGRRRAIATALCGAILVLPLWAFSPNIVLLVVGAFALQFLVQGAWGVIPAHITELAPDGVRGFLPGFGYQCGALIASGFTLVQALFAARVSFAWTMTLSAGLVFAGAAIVAAAGPERRGTSYSG